MIEVLYLLNNFSRSSGPLDRGLALLEFDDIRVDICSFFKNRSEYEKTKMFRENLIYIDAESKFDIKAWIRLYRIIKEKDYDIIHTHHHFTGILMRLFKISGLQFRKVHSFGNNYNEFSKLSRIAHDLTMFLEDQIICVSGEVENSFNFCEKKLIGKKTEVVYNGINIEEIDKERNKPIKTDDINFEMKDKLIGTVGRLIPQKDQKTLIKGFAEAKCKFDNIKLIIIGDGYLKDDLTSLVSELNLTDDVIFTGFIERKEVYRILFNLDLFVMTSLWEGFSAVVLQAMAADNPVILTDIPSFNEAVKNESSGEIVPPGNPDILAKTIIKILEKPSLSEYYSRNARRIVVKNFTVDKTAAGYRRVYNQLLQYAEARQ